MTIPADVAVRDLVAAHPGAVDVLEQLGIDYCCHGDAPLAAACSQKGVKVAEVIERVAAAERAAPVEEAPRWEQATLHQLIDHIVHRHHEYTRRAGQEIHALLPKVRAQHGAAHPELELIQQTCERLNRDLVFHMVKEERILFPYIERMESAARGDVPASPEPVMNSAQSPIRVMLEDHDAAGAMMAELRRLSGGFTPPADACASFRRLYQHLSELERDLHWHVHLENNVLFPRTLHMEAAQHS